MESNFFCPHFSKQMKNPILHTISAESLIGIFALFVVLLCYILGTSRLVKGTFIGFIAIITLVIAFYFGILSLHFVKRSKLDQWVGAIICILSLLWVVKLLGSAW